MPPPLTAEDVQFAERIGDPEAPRLRQQFEIDQRQIALDASNLVRGGLANQRASQGLRATPKLLMAEAGQLAAPDNSAQAVQDAAVAAGTWEGRNGTPIVSGVLNAAQGFDLRMLNSAAHLASDVGLRDYDPAEQAAMRAARGQTDAAVAEAPVGGTIGGLLPIVGAATAAPLVAAGAGLTAAGAALATPLAVGSMTAAEQYGEGRDMDMSPLEAAGRSVVQGGISGVGMSRLAMPFTGALHRSVGQRTSDILARQVQGVVEASMNAVPQAAIMAGGGGVADMAMGAALGNEDLAARGEESIASIPATTGEMAIVNGLLHGVHMPASIARERSQYRTQQGQLAADADRFQLKMDPSLERTGAEVAQIPAQEQARRAQAVQEYRDQQARNQLAAQQQADGEAMVARMAKREGSADVRDQMGVPRLDAGLVEPGPVAGENPVGDFIRRGTATNERLDRARMERDPAADLAAEREQADIAASQTVPPEIAHQRAAESAAQSGVRARRNAETQRLEDERQTLDQDQLGQKAVADADYLTQELAQRERDVLLSASRPDAYREAVKARDAARLEAQKVKGEADAYRARVRANAAKRDTLAKQLAATPYERAPDGPRAEPVPLPPKEVPHAPPAPPAPVDPVAGLASDAARFTPRTPDARGGPRAGDVPVPGVRPGGDGGGVRPGDAGPAGRPGAPAAGPGAAGGRPAGPPRAGVGSKFAPVPAGDRETTVRRAIDRWVGRMGGRLDRGSDGHLAVTTKDGFRVPVSEDTRAPEERLQDLRDNYEARVASAREKGAEDIPATLREFDRLPADEQARVVRDLSAVAETIMLGRTDANGRERIAITYDPQTPPDRLEAALAEEIHHVEYLTRLTDADRAVLAKATGSKDPNSVDAMEAAAEHYRTWKEQFGPEVGPVEQKLNGIFQRAANVFDRVLAWLGSDQAAARRVHRRVAKGTTAENAFAPAKTAQAGHATGAAEIAKAEKTLATAEDRVAALEKRVEEMSARLEAAGKGKDAGELRKSAAEQELAQLEADTEMAPADRAIAIDKKKAQIASAEKTVATGEAGEAKYDPVLKAAQEDVLTSKQEQEDAARAVAEVSGSGFASVRGPEYESWRKQLDTFLADSDIPAAHRKHITNTIDKARFALLGFFGGEARLPKVTTHDSPLRDNADPTMGVSADFVTTCLKRAVYTRYLDAVVAKLGRGLNQTEEQALRILARGHGLDAPCGYCYADSPRANAAKMIEERRGWLTGADAEIPAEILGGKRGAMTEAALAEAPPREVFDPMLPYKGEAEIAAWEAKWKDYPATRKLIKVQMGDSKAKATLDYAPMAGQILRMAKDKIAALNRWAGMRSQSWSDMTVDTIPDSMQKFAEMSAQGLRGHSYTKVEAYAEIFGKTGEKINLSLFPKLDANGKIQVGADGHMILDAEQSFPSMGKAKALRAKHADVGTMMMAPTKDAAWQALHDKAIDYVIPYHNSSQTKSIFESQHFENMGYVKFQVKDIAKLPAALQADGKIAMRGETIYGHTFGKDAKRLSRDESDRIAFTKLKALMAKHDITIGNKTFKDWFDRLEAEGNGHLFMKLVKDWARTDTPFRPVEVNFDRAAAKTAIDAWTAKLDAGEAGYADKRTDQVVVDPKTVGRLSESIQKHAGDQIIQKATAEAAALRAERGPTPPPGGPRGFASVKGDGDRPLEQAREFAAERAAARAAKPRASIQISHGPAGWLEGKRAEVRRAGTNEYGAPRMRSVTAYFDRALDLPVSWVRSLPGYNGENTRPMQQDSAEYLRPRMAAGDLPGGAITVSFDLNGKPWISEGNHRARLAGEQGADTVPVQVEYYDGGDTVAKLTPEKLLAMDTGVGPRGFASVKGGVTETTTKPKTTRPEEDVIDPAAGKPHTATQLHTAQFANRGATAAERQAERDLRPVYEAGKTRLSGDHRRDAAEALVHEKGGPKKFGRSYAAEAAKMDTDELAIANEAAIQVKHQLWTRAINGDDAALAQHADLATGLMTNATAAGKALQVFRDRFQTPAGRMAAFQSALFDPSPREAKAIAALRRTGEHSKADKRVEAVVRANKKAMLQLQREGWDIGNMRASDMRDTLFAARAWAAANAASARAQRGWNPLKLIGHTTAVAQSMWINNILSGPLTHAANLKGNVANSALFLTERLLLEPMARGAFGEAFTNATHVPMMLPSILRRAAVSAAISAKNNISELDVRHGRFNPEKEKDKYGDPLTGILKPLGVPGRALKAEDEFFRFFVAEATVHAHAARLAKGNAAEALRMVNNPESKAWEAALDGADEATFNNDTTITQLVGALRNAGREQLGFSPLGFIIPFVRAPVNVVSRGVRLTPVGLANIAAKSLLSETYRADSYKIRTELVESMLGTAMLGLGYTLLGYDEKENLGGTPTPALADPGRADYERRTGSTNFIRLLGTKVDYSRIEPLATYLGIVANARDAMQAAPEAKAAAIGASAVRSLAAITDKTFLKGIGDMVKLIHEVGASDRNKEQQTNGTLDRMLRSTAGGFVPFTALQRQMWQAIDEEGAFAGPAGLSSPTAERGATAGRDILRNAAPWVAAMNYDAPEIRYDLWGRPAQHWQAGTQSGMALTVAARMLGNTLSQTEVGEPAAWDAWLARVNDVASKPFYPIPPRPTVRDGAKSVYISEEEYVTLQKEAGADLLARLKRSGIDPTKPPADAKEADRLQLRLRALQGAANMVARRKALGDERARLDALTTERRGAQEND